MQKQLPNASEKMVKMMNDTVAIDISEDRISTAG